MSRSTPEWRGKSDDTKVPTRVRLRVFERHEGKCALSGRKILPGDAWDLDHITALINGGAHVESNLQPVLRDAHRKKTARDVAEKAKVARTRAKHIGAVEPAGNIKSPGFTPAEPQAKARKPLTKQLPPRRSLYA
jgi:5-methylcytosine-specific restriction endonuclease McrA